MYYLEKILAAFVFWGAGTGLFFFCLNRYVLMLPDYRAKNPLVLLTLALLTGGSLWMPACMGDGVVDFKRSRLWLSPSLCGRTRSVELLLPGGVIVGQFAGYVTSFRFGGRMPERAAYSFDGIPDDSIRLSFRVSTVDRALRFYVQDVRMTGISVWEEIS